ncbi:hypothetical protein KR038_003827 [Drosophila bunnanda]|nr:hypothetical protein KR038_003827 [Drosophila bunnanda]
MEISADTDPETSKYSLANRQRLAFEKLRNILASEDVILRYSDYKKAFDLTTDATDPGIGAVLSLEGRPITIISITLKDC